MGATELTQPLSVDWYKGYISAVKASGLMTSTSLIDASVLYKHKKNGDVYRIICTTNHDASNLAFKPTVVYMDVATNQIWSRELKEFIEKFIQLD